MGVKNLWDMLESCKKTLPLHHLQNKRVCIDLSCWMVQLQNVNKSYYSMKDKLYLRGLFHRLRALIALNCSLIFVTDGSIPAIKISSYRRRLKSGSEVTQDETNSQKVTSLQRNMGSEFSCMIKEAKVLGMALGIPCLNGIEEGEAQCALLNSESLCDGCFSSDSDAFLFGARTVYRDICLGEGGYVVCYEMADIERKLGYGRNSLITLAILLGGDYSQGVHGLGPESACQIVKSVGDNVILQKLAYEGLSFAKKSKCSKKQGQAFRCNNKENCLDYEMNNDAIEHNSQRNNQFLQVIDAYLKPKCHPADSDAVNRVFALLPFQRSKVQQICAQFFEWPPEKTDEYILPKIAERDLRRFANLRATSSELGLRLPLDKMPVKCPISGIIKQRKLQGRECFEVSWEEIDGLKTSIVPADLIESACPEKILEFEERRAQEKKPNNRKPRPKKTENTTSLKDVDLKLQELLLDIERGSSVTQKASLSTGTIPEKEYTVDLMNQDLLLGTESEDSIERNASISYYSASSSVAETEVVDRLSPSPSMGPPNSCQNRTTLKDIDLKLQELLLDIEQGSSVTQKASLSTGTILEKEYAVDLMNRDLLLGTESEGSIERNASISYYSASSSVAETEVIDLLSPSPSMRPPNITKSQKPNVQCIDVIDLSESETETSPEHERKAREFRLFLASIRKDIR